MSSTTNRAWSTSHLLASLSTGLALGLCACASGETPTEAPVGAPDLARGAGAYTTVDLGTLPGGAFSQAHDIISAGQVVGLSLNAEGAPRAFL